MAQGVDLWSSQIVLNLQKKNPALKFHCVLPCKGQESKWTASVQEHYRSILAQANEVIYKMCAAHGNMYAVIKEILRINEGLDIGGVRRPLTDLIKEDMPIVEEAARMIREAKAGIC